MVKLFIALATLYFVFVSNMHGLLPVDHVLRDLYDTIEDLLHVLWRDSIAKDTWSVLFIAIGHVGEFESIKDMQFFMFQNHNLHHKSL